VTRVGATTHHDGGAGVAQGVGAGEVVQGGGLGDGGDGAAGGAGRQAAAAAVEEQRRIAVGAPGVDPRRPPGKLGLPERLRDRHHGPGAGPPRRAVQRRLRQRVRAWRAALVGRFEPLGIAPERAAVLADLTMSALEGALVLSRAARSIQPFKTTVEALISAIDHDAAPQPAAP
jgi:hypothetical protein